MSSCLISLVGYVGLSHVDSQSCLVLSSISDSLQAWRGETVFLSDKRLTKSQAV